MKKFFAIQKVLLTLLTSFALSMVIQNVNQSCFVFWHQPKPPSDLDQYRIRK
jgi:cyclic lactone autoinducer peptide